MNNYLNQQMYNPTGGGGINPAMLSFNQQQGANKLNNFSPGGNINPAHLMGGMNNMNVGMSSLNAMSGMNGMGNMSGLGGMNNMGGMGVNPMNGTMNTQQLLGQPQQPQLSNGPSPMGGMSMGMNPNTSMNFMSGGLNMGMGSGLQNGLQNGNISSGGQGGGGGMNINLGGGMGINPSTLNMPISNNSNSSLSHGFSNMNPLANPNTQMQLFSQAGVSRDQFNNMSHQDRQQLASRLYTQTLHNNQIQQQNQIHQQRDFSQLQQQQQPQQSQHSPHQAQPQLFNQNIDLGQDMRASSSASAGLPNLFDRPSSAMSSLPAGLQAQTMAQPPRPGSQTGAISSLSRPGTAQSQQRPGTSLSHHSPTGNNTAGQQQPWNPPAPTMSLNTSSLGNVNNDFMGLNGFGLGGMPGTPQAQQQNTQFTGGFNNANPYPSTSPTFDGLGMGFPGPSSPQRSAKRKLGMGLDSPSMGNVVPAGLNSSMGPPELPRQMSSDAGRFPPPTGDLTAQINGFQMNHQMGTPVRPRAPSGADLKDLSFNTAHSPARQPSMPPAIPAMPTSPVKPIDNLPLISHDLPISSTAALPVSVAIPHQQSGTAPEGPRSPSAPETLSLDRETTRIELVKAEDLVPLSTTELEEVKQWKKRDTEYQALLAKTNKKMLDELREAVQPKWWEKGGEPLVSTRRKFDVRYPNHHRRGENRDKKKPRREGLRIPRRLSPEDANLPERLVPIRIEFDVEHQKMRETFVWNLNDPIVTPQNFAQSLADDYSLASHHVSTIVKSIHEQLSDYKAHSPDYDPDSGELLTAEVSIPQRGLLDEKDASWWEAWRKQLMSDYVNGRKLKRAAKIKKKKLGSSASLRTLSENDGTPEEDKALGVNEIRLNQRTLVEDMRVIIKLDIIVGSMKLDDQFEWDLDNSSESPEHFAEIYAKDLGLAGEFKTAIAHSIREQIQAYQKSLFIVGQPADSPIVQDEELRGAFLPSVTCAARHQDLISSFTPQLNHMTESDLERAEKDRERDMTRRRKRQNRSKRGGALPDREVIRTHRTPAIGFPDLNPATLAAAAAANAPVSRRAAAAAASLSIANMVASENNDRFSSPTPSAPQPVSAPAAPAPVPKEKKPKGLFKAPDYDRKAVLRPRAFIGGSTPTTAMESEDTGAAVEANLSSRPPDSRNKPVTAKRAKEIEREAKEKEFADGQHENIINGIWHCSNCGIPDSIAIGRRKGPLGDKSQCGTCGKYWHRHRKPRPVEYSTDLEFHQNQLRDPDSKAAPKRKPGRHANNASVEAYSEPQTPAIVVQELEAPSSPLVVPSDLPIERPGSAMSTVSSTSEQPLAQQAMVNGNGSERPAAPSPPPPETHPSQAPAEHMPSAEHPLDPWLSEARDAMQERYPDDKFVILLKTAAGLDPAGEWRLKCLDCPGKLYKPGPMESLSNFEVHLKNRGHRSRVNQRLANSNS